MRHKILAALALAIVAGCGPDDGAADFEKGEVAYAARDLQTAVVCDAVPSEKTQEAKGLVL